MNIKEAMHLVMDGKSYGTVLHKDTIDLDRPCYTDFKFSETKLAKRVMADREKLKKNIHEFIIVSVEQRPFNSEPMLLTIVKKDAVSFSDDVAVGDSVSLQITGNFTATWEVTQKRMKRCDPSKYAKNFESRKANREEFFCGSRGG